MASMSMLHFPFDESGKPTGLYKGRVAFPKVCS